MQTDGEGAPTALVHRPANLFTERLGHVTAGDEPVGDPAGPPHRALR